MKDKDEIIEYQKRIKELEEALEKEKIDKEKIKKEFEDTKKEFEEFKAKHAITVTHLTKALRIKPNSHQAPNIGGAPKGHKGYTRRIPARIDVIFSLMFFKSFQRPKKH